MNGSRSFQNARPLSVGLAGFALAALGACSIDASSRSASEHLSRRFPSFVWSESAAVSIDLDGDGSIDAAVLGHADGTAAVGVVLGNASEEPSSLHLEFSLRGASVQLGTCGRPATLRVVRQSRAPAEALGELPQGYRICPRCYELRVEEDPTPSLGVRACDPLHVYWNHELGDLGWWRP